MHVTLSDHRGVVLGAIIRDHEGRFDALPVFDDGGERFRALAAHRAAFGLALSTPAYSARKVATGRQVGAIVVGAVLAIAALCFRPALTAQLLVAGMSLGFLGSLTLRVLLACLGRKGAPVQTAANDQDFPIYTVLLPLYHEAEILPQLAAAMAALDYPEDKLDLKYIVEADDLLTRRAAEELGLKEIIVVPPGHPRTKPKACNYALQFARGEYLVIYDAEDRPDHDQLRKAIAGFEGDPDVACLQARLTIDNGSKAWLAEMFALDYGVWFRTLLPGLARLGAPIPLGGTSNHFQTSVLRKAGAWDPFNVTEDADLGYRLARLGYRVSMLDSSTLEAAPVGLGIWLRQRTRWMKGYMQTALVHTRNPLLLLRGVGCRGCLTMHAFLGGAIWSGLVNPLLWIVFVASALQAQAAPGMLDVLAWTSGTTLLLANGLLAVLSLFYRHGRVPLSEIPAILTYPIYWMLISLAAYRALWQLLRDPFGWEKTPHGPS